MNHPPRLVDVARRSRLRGRACRRAPIVDAAGTGKALKTGLLVAQNNPGGSLQHPGADALPYVLDQLHQPLWRRFTRRHHEQLGLVRQRQVAEVAHLLLRGPEGLAPEAVTEQHRLGALEQRVHGSPMAGGVEIDEGLDIIPGGVTQQLVLAKLQQVLVESVGPVDGVGQTGQGNSVGAPPGAKESLSAEEVVEKRTVAVRKGVGATLAEEVEKAATGWGYLDSDGSDGMTLPRYERVPDLGHVARAIRQGGCGR